MVEIHHFDQIHSFKILGGVHPISTVGIKSPKKVKIHGFGEVRDQVQIGGPGKNGGACAYGGPKIMVSKVRKF